MLFLPKWTQNVSKFILFNKWTAIFKLDINFSIFYQFSCFWNVFVNISKCGKLQTWVTGTDEIQKRNIYLRRFLVNMLSRCVSTKLCFRIFNLVFSNLNYVVKLPDWPVSGYHGNRIKIRRHSFVRIVITHLPPKYG